MGALFSTTAFWKRIEMQLVGAFQTVELRTVRFGPRR